MGQWSVTESMKLTADRMSAELKHSGCTTVGIDSVNFHIEYPLQALLRERNPGVQFVHTGVSNQSSRYPQPSAAKPCAVVCLNCAGDSPRRELYHDFRESGQAGGIVTFSRAPEE
jgi:hypothetical protein